MSEAAWDDVERLGQKRRQQLDTVDQMPPSLRRCVHEYGFSIVNCLRNQGITDPQAIDTIVKEIWCGPRETSGSQRSTAKTAAEKRLDWLLISTGSPLTGATVLRHLHSVGLVVVPSSPTAAMIEASMDAVNHMGVVSKREKHLRRLRSAIAAEALKYAPPAPQKQEEGR